MWKRFAIVCSVLLSGAAASCVSAATVDSTIHFRLIDRKDRVEAAWERYPYPKAFASYFIVRSEPGGPKAPEAGDIVATTTNRYSTNAEDHPEKNGTYYYRLCVNKKDKSIVCSRASKIVVSGVKPQATKAAAFSSIPAPVVIVPSGASATDPIVQVLDAAPGEMTLTLASSASGTVLGWTPAASLSTSFMSYVLVRSFTTSAPSYPVDGYLAKIRSLSTTTFTDTVYVDPAMIHAQRFYRVCAVNAANTVHCGSAATITPSS